MTIPNEIDVTLVQSVIKNKPYTKIDGKYSGPTWKNNIGRFKIGYTIGEVSKMMRNLSEKPEMCMVTGTARQDKITGTNRTMRNFLEQPIYLLTVDLDKYEGPNIAKHGDKATYDHLTKDADDFIRQHLPPEFHKASYIMRLSSSMFIKKDPLLRAHLTFLLAEPQYPRELGLWMKTEKIPADPTFYFNMTQPIFTAAPIFDKMLDPLQLRTIPRVSTVMKERDHVSGDWKPYDFGGPKDAMRVKDMPKSSRLPGRVGSFCRMTDLHKIMEMLGYRSNGSGRYLSPTSDTNVPGAIVFDNGYVFSHHSDDPINLVVEKVHGFRRRSLNAYDLLKGWAILNRESDPSILQEFEYLQGQAIISDSRYLNEISDEMKARTEWMTEDEYANENKEIIDGIMQDMLYHMMPEIKREPIFDLIVAKTNKIIKKQALKNLWKNLRKDKAMNSDTFDPEAGLRFMSNIFARQDILFAVSGDEHGHFWCYDRNTRIWRRNTKSQTDSYIYNTIHAAMPLKIEIDFYKTEQLVKLIKRAACESRKEFIPGKGWAFKGGKYGMSMDGLFRGTKWTPDGAIKTLGKTDRIWKELPVTYRDWKKTRRISPERFIDFLLTSTEEDIEVVELLREYGGYVFADSKALHKFLILEGVPGSGKSIFANILGGVIGRDYRAATSINRLSTQFGLGELPGKKLALLSEARAIDFKALKAAVPIFLKVTGNDPVDIEAKYRQNVTEYLDAKLLIITNMMPVLPDDTGALSQRLMICKFNKCFRGTDEEKLGLDNDILRYEKPMVIRWFLEGLARLQHRGHFLIPESSRDVVESFEEQLDPLKSFIERFFSISGDPEKGWISQTEFIRYFMYYLQRIGQGNAKQPRESARKRGSIRSIKAVIPGAKIHQQRVDGNRVRMIRPLLPNTDLGLEFAEEAEILLDMD